MIEAAPIQPLTDSDEILPPAGEAATCRHWGRCTGLTTCSGTGPIGTHGHRMHKAAP
jgi:hypothetical protein